MVIKQMTIAFSNNEREFFVPRTAAMLKISLPSGSVNVYGRMTSTESYVKISGVKNDMTISASATAGITSFEIAGFYSVKIVNTDAPADGVVSTLIG